MCPVLGSEFKGKLGRTSLMISDHYATHLSSVLHRDKHSSQYSEVSYPTIGQRTLFYEQEHCAVASGSGERTAGRLLALVFYGFWYRLYESARSIRRRRDQ